MRLIHKRDRGAMKGYSSVRVDEDDSAWDHIFANIDEDVAISRNSTPQRVTTKRSMRPPASIHGAESPIQRRYSRRPPMTASEKNAFDSMFDMIFKATTQKKENFTTAAVTLPLKKSLEQRSTGWSWLRHNLSEDIDVTGSSTNDIDSEFKFPSPASSDVLPLPRLPPDTYGKLRNLPKRTTALEQLLDQKKEEVALCHSDLQVLGWAVRELFGEADLENISSTSTQTKDIPLPPALYAPLLAYLMQFFISHPYYNYHTALALFTYAKTLSSASYVFGCNTAAYNVYLQARWAVEQDINEILVVLREMDANGVNYDFDTRTFFQKVRRDIEEKWRNSEDLFVNDSSNPDEGDSNSFLILERAEQLLQNKRRTSFSNLNDKSRLDRNFSRDPRELQIGEEDGLTLT
ncbi:hypothetical protein Clacol_003595 [Clathrus columnatus]|uniref:Mtf2-like C-terminal domain-containing protein n=1 Tax=Clathrus columnatus TaxID=1419009 RepID=A0AAV5A9P0_9AGAM|nr:hypothetical protein Clacol_003595 [Clathrus columnatus]